MEPHTTTSSAPGGGHAAWSLPQGPVVEPPGVASLTVGVDGGIGPWSEGARRLTGRWPQETVGRPFRVLFRQEDRDAAVVLLEGAPETGQWRSATLRLRRAAREDLLVEVSARIRRDQCGWEIVIRSLEAGTMAGRVRWAAVEAAADGHGVGTACHAVIRRLAQESCAAAGEVLLPVDDRLHPATAWGRDAASRRSLHAIQGRRTAPATGEGDLGEAWGSRRAVWCRTPEGPGPAGVLGDGLAVPGICDGEVAVVVALYGGPSWRSTVDAVGVQEAVDAAAPYLARLRRWEIARAGGGRDAAHAMQGLLDRQRAMESFAYHASHDLKEPLRAVKECLQLAMDGLPQGPRHLLDVASSECERLQRLVHSLLRLADVRHGAPDVRRVDLGASVEAVRRDLSVRMRESGAVLETGVLPGLDADPDLLQHLLLNLVANAIDHHPGSPRIRIDAQEGEDGCCLSVQDDGPGIPPGDAERVFRPFERGPGDGSGLGLALARAIVERHGGRIWVEPGVAVGATVRALFPHRQGVGQGGAA